MRETRDESLPERLMPIREIERLLGRSRASIYRDIKRNAFPRPIKVGHSSRWPVSDLREFIGHRVASRG